MTKRHRAPLDCVNAYVCPDTGVMIKSQCAHRLHIKKCQMCAVTPTPKSELLGKKFTNSRSVKETDPTFAQKDVYIDGQWE